jgi:hypothetical protein
MRSSIFSKIGRWGRPFFKAVIATGDAEPIQEVFRCKQRRHSRAARGKCRIGQEMFAAGVLVLAVFFHLFCASEATALEAANQPGQNPQGDAPEARQKLGKEWSEYADLVATYNPLGLDLSGGYEYKDSYRYDSRYDAVSSYWQTGAGIDISPAFARPSIDFEWMPVLFFVANLEYDGYYYFGANGGLLSFSSGNDPFGDQELRARRGTEESGVGSRLLFQPTVQLKIGDIVLRNQSDIAKYRFPGKGPFFLEQEYDTLLKNGDHLFANRTQALKEISGGPGNGSIFLGPYYELVHAEAAELTRQQIGVLFYSEQDHKNRPFATRHFFAEIGYNLKDRNREHQIFFLIGVGGSSVLR